MTSTATTGVTARPTTAAAGPGAPAATARRGGRRTAAPAPPLGSLTQGGADGRGTGDPCPACASTAVTNLTMTLADGTSASLTSCRTCGERRWAGSGQRLSIAEVLARARRS